MSNFTEPHPGPVGAGRGSRLDQALADLLGQAPELEAAAVVSFDGLAMASALPVGMDEDRVAAMSAALLSLGEKAAEGLGRGDLSQVYIEGENGTVYLISAQDEAVLVAVASRGAKAGLMLFEVRRAAAVVGDILAEDVPQAVVTEFPTYAVVEEIVPEPVLAPVIVTAVVPTPAPEAPLPQPILSYPTSSETFVAGPQLVPDLPVDAPEPEWSPYSAQPASVLPGANGSHRWS